MISPMQFLMSQIQQNPNIANNPQAQSYIQIIQSGDQKKGEEIAQNLLKSYGMTKEQGMTQVKRFFPFLKQVK